MFQLSAACIEGPNAFVLGPLTVDFGPRVTALLGPSATGKSLLLRALANEPLPPGFSLRGSWRREASRPLYVSQTSRAPEVFDGYDALLLDEPDRSAADAEALARALRGKSAVIVTHDLAFAQRVAEDVALVCAGVVAARGSCAEFFSSPPNELAARFVREGNCWPKATTPALPRHFRWLEPDKLAGMGRPGLLRDADDDLFALAMAGVTMVVSLTEEPLPQAKLRSFGLASNHFPIRDMDVPRVDRAMVLCRTLARAIDSGQRVVVHCHAGLGRTGTILAAYLVWRGASASSAIARVRALEPSMIQNRAQEAFVESFAFALGH